VAKRLCRCVGRKNGGGRIDAGFHGENSLKIDDKKTESDATFYCIGVAMWY
jgi:hypothetical protein